MRELKQSTAANVMVFMADAADHITGKTGLTLSITASKDGGAFAAITPAVTERGSGWYALALTTAHTDTLGELVLHVTATGADPTDRAFRVVVVDPGSLIAAYDAAKTAAAAGAAMTLDSGERGAVAITIRGELAAELSRMDASVSSRLAATDYVEPGEAGIQILPLMTSVQTQPVRPASIVAYELAAITHRIAVFDAAGQPIDLTGRSLQFVVATLSGAEVQFSNDVTIEGADHNIVTVAAPAGWHGTPGLYRYAVRDPAQGNAVWAHGEYRIEPAAGPHVAA